MKIDSNYAEKKIIGILMNHPEMIAEKGISAIHFLDNQNRSAFNAIKEMYEYGKTTIKPWDLGKALGVEEGFFEQGEIDEFNYYFEMVSRNSLIYGINLKISQMEQDLEKSSIEDFKEMSLVEIRDYYIKFFSEETSKYIPNIVDEFEDIDDLTEEEEEWLVEGMFLENTFNSITAAAKCGKSQFAYQLAYCVQNGIDFLGCKTKKKDVLYIDYELRDKNIKKRLRYAREFYENQGMGFKVLRLASKVTDFDVVVKKVQDSITENTGLIVFDCYYRFAKGDMNSAVDVSRTLEPIKALAKNGVTVFYIHHEGKTPDGKSLNSGNGSAAHSYIVDESVRIKHKASNEFEITIGGRDFSDVTYKCIMDESTRWYFQRLLGCDEEKDPKEKAPEIYKKIEENGGKMAYKNLKTYFNYTPNELRAFGFYVDRSTGSYTVYLEKPKEDRRGLKCTQNKS